MELLLQRFSTGPVSTLGMLHKLHERHPRARREFRCFTMEDEPNDPKVPGHTRIPAGRYQIKLRHEGTMNRRYRTKFSTFHEGMLWLQDVPGFEWIYIHYGNYHGDSAGCILTGDGSQSNVDEDGMVTSSIAAYRRLYHEIIDEMQTGDADDHPEVWITIEDFA